MKDVFVCQQCGAVNEEPRIKEKDVLEMQYDSKNTMIREEVNGVIKFWNCKTCGARHIICKPPEVKEKEKEYRIMIESSAKIEESDKQ